MKFFRAESSTFEFRFKNTKDVYTADSVYDKGWCLDPKKSSLVSVSWKKNWLEAKMSDKVGLMLCTSVPQYSFSGVPQVPVNIPSP